MIQPADDYPHPVPPQAFMVWKENWVFPAVDTEQRVASLFHFSLRPAHGEGIFTAKFCIDGEEHRYVGRSPIPRDISRLRPVANERLSFEVVEPGRRFRIRFEGEELSADILYTARFGAWDFADGPKAPGESVLGELGRSVFPFNHYEQSLHHEGTLTLASGETIALSGYACRDHSWGWREDLTFDFHHWICAGFEDRYFQGSVMQEDLYPHGPKMGGWVSTADGNEAIAKVDTSEAYWLEPGRPLGLVDRDVRYRLTTVGGEAVTLVAHIADDYGRLYLDARSRDRATVYQDVQIFCDYTLEETGERGAGVLEIGKRATGEGVADAPEYRRSAVRR
jgi:hypothetical protein